MFKKISLFLLRISLGVFFFFDGYTKLIDPDWSAAGYIASSKTFIGFYSWLLQPNILPTVNFLNEWGLILIGTALLLGIFVRLASLFGIIMMILYYLPIFPPEGSLINIHIIYSLVFLVFMAFGAGNVLTLNNWVQTRLHPMWHKWAD